MRRGVRPFGVRTMGAILLVAGAVSLLFAGVFVVLDQREPGVSPRAEAGSPLFTDAERQLTVWGSPAGVDPGSVVCTLTTVSGRDAGALAGPVGEPAVRDVGGSSWVELGAWQAETSSRSLEVTCSGGGLERFGVQPPAASANLLPIAALAAVLAVAAFAVGAILFTVGASTRTRGR